MTMMMEMTMMTRRFLLLSLIVVLLLTTVFIPKPSFAKSQDPKQNYDFTKEYRHKDPLIFLQYPIYWDLKEGHGNWVVTFYDDIEEWEMRVDAYFYDIDKSVANLVPKKYVEYMFVTYKTFCEKRIYDKDGYLCFDFIPIGFKTEVQNGLEIRQVTFSWTQLYQDGSFFENTSTITDILYKDKLINVQYQANIDDYKWHIEDYNRLLYSIKFETDADFDKSNKIIWSDKF